VKLKSLLPVGCLGGVDEGNFPLVRSKKRNRFADAKGNKPCSRTNCDVVVGEGGGIIAGLAAQTPTPRGARCRTMSPSSSRRRRT
jgi:hypothetical protein